MNKRRCTQPSPERNREIPIAANSDKDEPKKYEAYRSHRSADALLAAGCHDLRTFIGLKASHVTITATVNNPAEAITFVARHEVHVLCENQAKEGSQVESSGRGEEVESAHAIAIE